MAENTNNEAPSSGGEVKKLEVYRGWRIAVGFGIFAVFGSYSAHLIPAFAGLETNPLNGFNLMFVTGLLGYFYRKSCGLSGGMGWLVGGVIGLLVFTGGGFVKGYHRAQIANEAAYQEAVDEIEKFNESLPEMVDDDLRFDRVTWTKDGPEYFFTYVNSTATDLVGDISSDEYVSTFTSDVCAKRGTEDAAMPGAIFTYYFFDQDGEEVVTTTFTESDCN